MNFEKFIENDNLKNSLEAIENHNRMPHAIVINGGTEESRSAVALFLSMWAVCRGEEKPCYVCKECITAENKNHSDIYFAKGEGKTGIYNKAEINRIIKDSYIKPNQADKKVFVLEECDKRFPVICQNAFLKTLEEPPQNVLFILTCENSKSLLSTIRSRVTVFNLESETDLDEETLELSKEIALGLVSTREIDLLKSLNKLTTRDSFISVLECLILLFRDGLAVSVDSKAVTHEETAFSLCRRLTKKQYLKLIEISGDAIVKVNQNVSLKLISTWLCGEYRRISWQR